MPEIAETMLPGVGVRHDFVTDAGTRIGVITARSGRRQLLVYDRRDPDRCAATLELDEDESRTLADLLGGSRISGTLANLEAIEGLVIDWLHLTGAVEGRTLGEFEVRSRTGVSIVAVLRGQKAFPAVGPSFELQEGDHVVVVGTAEGVRQAAGLLHAA